MTRSEKRWVLIFSSIVLLITTLPFLVGFWLQGSEWRFTGFFIGVEDGNSYIAKMLIGSAGDWLFRTPYTAYPQNGFLAFLPYILLGKLISGAGQHEQLVALFQIFRWAGGYVMIYATYRFIGYFIEDARGRKWATAIATLGGGFGWLAFVGLQGVWGGRIPLEVYSPETFGFLSIFTLPHLAMARGLLLLGLLAYWRGYQTQVTGWRLILNGLLWVGLGLLQPLTVLIGWMIVGLDVIVRFAGQHYGWFKTENWRWGLTNGTVMVAASAPLVIYTAVSFFTDPFLKIWSAQNIILSPPVGDYLMAFGITFPFLYLGFKKLFQVKRVESYVLTGWIVLLPFLAYFPYNLQRRLPEGIWVALAIVTALGLAGLRGNWARIGRIFVYTSFLTTFLVMFGSLLSEVQLNPPIYRPVDETAAFQFIQAHNANFPVVIAAYDTANALPAWAPVRTLIGHGPESIHLKEIQPRVEAFYQGTTTDQDRLALIHEFNIQYVIWGPLEQQLGTWDPASMGGLAAVYQNATYRVYKVEN
jgi:hypothetical protein